MDMQRRTLLKSLGALAAAPMLPSLPLASPHAAAMTTSAVDASTYKWAEMIVRAHNKCTPAMLQRLIGLSPANAAALQAEFLAKGVIGAPSQFGIHQATKPLWQGAFPKPHVQTKKAVEMVEQLLDHVSEPDDEPTEINAPENENATTAQCHDDVIEDMPVVGG